MNCHKRKNAFTLAEVLITLGIIGVVAAMTLPTLINTTNNKQLEAQLKKTYSELNQISRKFYVDHNESFPEYALRVGDLQQFANTFMSYYKGSNKVNEYTYVEDISNAPYPLYLINGDPADTVLCDDGGYYSEVSGKVFLFNNLPPSFENGPVICVDINGYKGPNKFGYDYFMFTFTTDGYVVPMGQQYKNHTSNNRWNTNFYVEGYAYCSKNGTQAIRNAACAYYALQNRSPLNDDETYWGDYLKNN